MKIGFVGAGNMAGVLAAKFIEGGHTVLLSHSRDRQKLEGLAQSLGKGTRVGSAREAVAFADVVVLAVGWSGVEGALEAAGSFDGKALWSIVNPIKADFSGLAVGTTTSGSESIAARAKDARLVAGWPPFAEVLASGSTHFGDDRPTTFFCGDDAEAKRQVLPLIEALDVDAYDAGPLYAARFIEPAMFLLVHITYGQKHGPAGARLLRR
jgi:predicted dinucleotide-binding enzyme